MTTLELEEGQRQMLLLALAELALARPGWDWALSAIAGQVDNPPPDSMYEAMKRLGHGEHPTPMETVLKDRRLHPDACIMYPGVVVEPPIGAFVKNLSEYAETAEFPGKPTLCYVVDQGVRYRVTVEKLR